MKLCNIHIKNLIILSISGIFKGFKNWQKVAEICYQLVPHRASRGLALFLTWRHRLIYMALTLCEHACKTVFDVKSRIDPCPPLARSWDKAYQISGFTVASHADVLRLVTSSSPRTSAELMSCLVSCILWRPAVWLELIASKTCCFLSRIEYLSSSGFSSETFF